MDAKTITLSALLAATSAGLIYQMGDGGKYEPVALAVEPTADAVVAAAPADIQAKIAEVGPGVTCARCETGLWDGKARVMTEGWCCGGAWMPRAVAEALDVAEVEASKPKVVEEIEGEAVKP